MLVLTLIAADHGRARLFLGEIPLHLTPLPRAPLILALTDALADALAGQRPRGVRLDDGYRLALTPDGPTALSVSVRRPAGPTLLRRQPLVPARIRQDLLGWIAEARADHQLPAALAERLGDAAERLQGRAAGHHPPPPRPPSKLVDLQLAPVRVAPRRLEAIWLAWLAILEAALANPEHPLAPQRIPLDDTGQTLWIVRRGRALERQIVDADGRSRSERVAGGLTALARNAPGEIHAQVGLRPAAIEQLTARALRLARWSEALSLRPAEAPLWQPTPAAPERLPPALPVAGLFHLAYRRRWSAPVERLRHAVLVDDSVWLTDAGGLSAVDRRSGARRWHHAGWQGLGPAAPQLALDAQGHLVHPTPRHFWRRPDLPPPRKLLCADAGRWILVFEDHLEALDPRTGARQWIDPGHGQITGVSLADDGIWITGDDRQLRCLDQATGVERTRLPLAGEAIGPPVPWASGVLALTERWPGRSVISGWPAAGAGRAWSFELPEAPLDRPRLDGSRLLITTGDPRAPRLWALDPLSGALRWQTALPGGVAPPRIRSTAQGPVAKALDGATLGLDPDDGSCRWTLPLDDHAGLVTHNPPPLACRGLLIIAAATVRAVDPATGRVAHTLRSDGLVPDRIQVWPDADVLISEPDGAAYFSLEGHLALVD